MSNCAELAAGRGSAQVSRKFASTTALRGWHSGGSSWSARLGVCVAVRHIVVSIQRRSHMVRFFLIFLFRQILIHQNFWQHSCIYINMYKNRTSSWRGLCNALCQTNWVFHYFVPKRLWRSLFDDRKELEYLMWLLTWQWMCVGVNSDED